MKVQLLIVFAFAFLAALATADSLQDEIDAARKKFCGGISVSKPTKGQVFNNPKKVKVTVKRKPNSLAKVINAVDLYMVNQNGTAKYLGTPWKNSYQLHTSATMTVDLTRAKGAKFPRQYEFRVWVRNEAGPDCTLMSKVFKARYPSHSNAAEEAEELAQLSPNIDKGCFGIDITKPAIGDHVSGRYQVQVAHDSASPVDTLTKVELFKVDVEDRQPIKVQESWVGDSLLYESFNIKDSLKEAATDDGKEYAYFYKLSGITQHDESCEFYSHPFYIDA
ncbi:hypothetical protein BDA99DRAFT_494863 [Phascolomyces articulosus]|uniref:Uncharacterized protein n=1 Tax=Phascolomyces articulosus TaxID=60185 RepID=A0AAD5PIT7_9FUNG|nr:hypothetical protein BDA99DRAFT_494863 [Phascolomyces articulosus]